MNRNAVFWVLLVMLLLLLVGGTLVLWPGGAGFMPWIGRGMPGVGPGATSQGLPQGSPGYPGAAYGQVGLGALSLDDEQVSRINTILGDLTARERNLELQMMDAQGELWRRQAAGAQDPKAVREAYDRLAKLQQQAYADRVAAQERIASVLTPEQRSRWQGRRQDR